MPETSKKYRGSALLIVIAMMVVLSVMGVSFLRISTYENAASVNYVARVEAQLTAWAGIERAVAEIYNQLRSQGHVDWEDSAKYKSAKYKSTIFDLEIATRPNNTEQEISFYAGDVFPDATTYGYFYSGQVGYRDATNANIVYGRYEPGGNIYSLKIKPSAAGFNLNSHISSDVANQPHSNRIVNGILKSLARECGVAQDQATADALRPLAWDPQTDQYLSMENVIDALNNASITDNTNRQEFLSNLTVGSWVDFKTAGSTRAAQIVNANPFATYYIERRAPVNMNTITEELLVALIENIKATTVLYNINLKSGDYKDETATGKNYKTETKMWDKIQPRTVDISFTTSQARTIAQKLITKRPFFDRGDFEKEVEKVNLPGPPQTWINSDDWEKALEDTLKSNFNPNVIDNYWNPNASINLQVCKGDIFENSNPPQPSHTTELCFYSYGDIEITSLGRVLAQNGSVIAGKSTISTRVRFSELLRHSTQADFGAGDGDTISYPVVLNRTGSAYDDIAGGIEPKPYKITASSNPYAPDFTSTATFPSGYTGGKSPRKMGTNFLRDAGVNNLAHDGIVSMLHQYANGKASQARYFTVKAIGYGSDLQTNVSGKIGNYTGTIGFWVKLSHRVGKSGKPSVPFGLLSTTTVSKTLYPVPSPNLSDIVTDKRREGMKMVAYINTLGKLRVSRIYYAMYWDSSVSKWRGAVFPTDGDRNRALPRRDAVIDVKNWKPNTWHYIRITWDDTKGKSSKKHLKVWVDNNKDPAVDGKQAEISTSELQGEFAVLNESDPKDEFYINGFYRVQAQKGGYFHFDTVVDMPGNATIDGLTSYSGAQNNLSKIPRKYVTDVSVYTNKFTLPGPTDTTPIPADTYWLGPLRWTSYPRTSASGAYVICGSDTGQSYYSMPTSLGSSPAQGQGIIPSSTSTVVNGADVKYKAELKVQTKLSGNNLQIDCPALESVSLVLYHSRPLMTYVQID